jgi:hypothetical protein
MAKYMVEGMTDGGKGIHESSVEIVDNGKNREGRNDGGDHLKSWGRV